MSRFSLFAPGERRFWRLPRHRQAEGMGAAAEQAQHPAQGPKEQHQHHGSFKQGAEEVEAHRGGGWCEFAVLVGVRGLSFALALASI